MEETILLLDVSAHKEMLTLQLRQTMANKEGTMLKKGIFKYGQVIRDVNLKREIV